MKQSRISDRGSRSVERVVRDADRMLSTQPSAPSSPHWTLNAQRSTLKAFTLVELLTVMAITAILVTLIVVPLIQGFNLTRQGQAIAQAEDNARLISNRIASEIGNAAGVRDNTGPKGSITVVVPGPAGGGGLRPDVPETLPYAKIDIVKPAEGDPTKGPSGAFINPGTGKEDPTLHAPKGQITLPLAPGSTIVRYWIALREPLDGQNRPLRYTNPYEGVMMAKSAGRDNLYSLYRAEIQPYVYTSQGPVVNAALFQDANNDNIPDDIDDPAFFTMLPTTDYNPTTMVLTTSGTAKVKRIRNWQGGGVATESVTNPYNPGGPKITIQCPLGQAKVLTELSRFDMIQPQFDLRSRQVIYDNTTDYVEPTTTQPRPRIIPLAQFKPTRVSSDPAEGEQAVRLGEEADNSTDIAPDVFTTRLGGWANSVIRTWPGKYGTFTGFDQTNPNTNEYLVGRTDPRAGQPGFAPGFSIYYFDPDSGGEPTLDGIELFDVATYQQGVSNSTAYPFSNAIKQADSRSNWLGNADIAKIRTIFTPYFPDSLAGKIIGSFGINEVGSSALLTPPNDPNNLPQSLTGLSSSPLQDTGAGENYSPESGVYHINGCFNLVWNTYPNLRPDVQRFIDLRVTKQGDGIASPLNPDPTVGFPRARIVPGSEQVFGPDQLPGANYGRTVRYSRTTQNPGPDQYKINYVDLAEPDYAVMGIPPPPPTYTPTDFTSAVIQPRFKAGYIQLNSDPNAPLPNGTDPVLQPGNFQVFYRFQFTHPNDAFAVDYDSRQVLSINLTIRTFPQSNFPNAAGIALKTSAIVRNFIR